jgi:hypothetical protein
MKMPPETHCYCPVTSNPALAAQYPFMPWAREFYFPPDLPVGFNPQQQIASGRIGLN